MQRQFIKWHCIYLILVQFDFTGKQWKGFECRTHFQLEYLEVKGAGQSSENKTNYSNQFIKLWPELSAQVASLEADTSQKFRITVKVFARIKH